MKDPIMSDVAPLLEKAFDELAIRRPTRIEAAWMLARSCIERIASGEQRPIEALAQLSDVYMAAHVLPDRQYVGNGLDINGTGIV